MNEKSELAVFDGYNKQKIEVMFQEEANLEVKMPLFYVNSGKKELESYVEDNCKPELAEYTVSKQGELSAAVEEVYKPELKTYTESRKEDILYYVESTSKPKIDDYVDAEIVPHSTSAQNAAAAALASEQAAKISEDNAKASELAAAESAAEAKQYRDEAEEIIHPVQATEDSLGLAAIATEEEVAAGANDDKFVTPLKVSGYYQSKSAANSEYEKIQESLAQKANKSEIFSAGNIGDIKYTSRVDVPAGGVWCDGSEYTKTSFPDVYQMLVDGNLQNTDYTSYNDAISTNGSCGFFALDTSSEKFKVPMLSNVYVKAGQAPLMFGVESLPNITGNLKDAVLDTSSGDGVFSISIGAVTGGGTTAGNKRNASFDASRSSSTYQDGSKVNPDHVVYRAYVVLYASAAEASEAQAAEFMTALGSKANVDMNNINIAGKENVVNWCVPDYSGMIAINGTSYTASCAGFIDVFCAGDQERVFIDGVQAALAAGGQGHSVDVMIPIAKGSTASVTRGGSTTLMMIRHFVPLKGVSNA